jgi:hypothetical protein
MDRLRLEESTNNKNKKRSRSDFEESKDVMPPVVQRVTKRRRRNHSELGDINEANESREVSEVDIGERVPAHSREKTKDIQKKR